MTAALLVILALLITFDGLPPNDGEPMTMAMLSYADPDYLDELHDMAGPHGWGLTYAWDAYEDGSVNPATTAYAITTALVLQAFLDAGRAGAAERAIADEWARCCFSDGFFWYSDQPADAIFTPNVTAMMASVMLRLGHTTEADAAIRRLIEGTDRPGWPAWRYSAASEKPNDLLHHFYTVWGIESYRADGGSVPIPWSAEDALAAMPDDPLLWPVAAVAARAAFARCFTSVSPPEMTVEPSNLPHTRRDQAHAVFAAMACP